MSSEKIGFVEEPPRPTSDPGNAVVMVSIGDRPWRDAAAETYRRYAQRHRLALHVETELPRDLQLSPLPANIGRPNKIAYACKTYFAWKHLATHARVMVVDDTSCVRTSAPNIFDLVPLGLCGFTRTHPGHAEKSFMAIRKFIAEAGLPEIDYDPDHYMNSGLMLYDRSMRAALSPARIKAASELLLATYPHQTLCYYLLKRGGIAPHVLPKKFNAFPALKLTAQERRALSNIRPYIDSSVFVYHVSAGYKHRNRIVHEISRAFLADEVHQPDPREHPGAGREL